MTEFRATREVSHATDRQSARSPDSWYITASDDDDVDGGRSVCTQVCMHEDCRVDVVRVIRQSDEVR